jgi:hypothetical protein
MPKKDRSNTPDSSSKTGLRQKFRSLVPRVTIALGLRDNKRGVGTEGKHIYAQDITYLKVNLNYSGRSVQVPTSLTNAVFQNLHITNDGNDTSMFNQANNFSMHNTTINTYLGNQYII